MEKLKNALLDKAKMHLNEEDYTKLSYYVKNQMWVNLRVFLSDLADMCEIRGMLEDDRADEWLAMDDMNNIAIEIAIEKNDDVDDGNSRTRRKRISRGSKAIV